MDASISAAKQSRSASVAIHEARPCSLDVVAPANPSVRIDPVSCCAVPKNKKAAGQAPAHVRNGLIGSFAW